MLSLLNQPFCDLMGFLDQVKQSFSSQPTEYQEPTRVQKLQSLYEQKLTPRLRKVCKVAFPILIVVVSIGAGVTAAYFAPEGWDKTLGTMIMLNVGGIAMGGYQFAVWRWGKSYSEQMMKVKGYDEELIKEMRKRNDLVGLLKAEQERWNNKLEWFKNHQKWFRDFDTANYEDAIVGGSHQQRLRHISELLENCPEARAVTLHTDISKEVLGKIKGLKHLKRLTFDLSKSKGEQTELLKSILETDANGDLVPNPSIRHLNLMMNPADKPRGGENQADLDHAELSSEFMQTLVQYFPNLKTLQASHMDRKAWVHLGGLRRIKEITLEVNSLREFDIEDARNIEAFRNAVLRNSVTFKQVKLIHPLWKEQNNYRDFDTFQDAVRHHIENVAHITTEDQDGQDNLKKTMVLYIAKTMAERWASVKKFFS